MTCDEIKNKILKTLNNDNVIYDTNIISANDFINAINEELYEIKHLLKNKEIYCHSFKIPKCRMFKNTLSNLGSHLSYIDIGYNMIIFKFEKGFDCDNPSKEAFISISNDIKGNLSYEYNNTNLNKDFIQEFVNINLYLIRSIFKIINEFQDKYGINIGFGDNLELFPNKQIISDDNFYCIMLDSSYTEHLGYQLEFMDSLGNFVVNENSDPSLLEFILENENELLKKIPITINRLNSLYQSVITNYMDDKKKIKKLVK